MSKYLCALLVASLGIAVSMPHALAQSTPAAVKKTSKKPAAKKRAAKSGAKKKAVEPAEKEEDDIVPDIIGSTTVDYNCELGNKVTIYENQTDSQHVAVRWNQKLHRLTRVGTTTGASRFENKKYGLVWIGIPSKGILLDSKKGQQLANECKNAEQLLPKPQEVTLKADETAVPPQATPVDAPPAAPPAQQTDLAPQ